MSGREQAVIYLPGVTWDAVKGTDRHLAEGMARRFPVLWVDPPLSVVHRREESGRHHPAIGVGRPAPGVTRLTYLAPPFPERRWVAQVTRTWGRLVLRGVLDRIGVDPVAVVNTSPTTDFDLVPGARVRRVYHATDDFVAGADLMGMSSGLLAAHERRRVAQADVVTAVSEQIMERWDTRAPRMVLPNGCDVDTYAVTDEVEPAADVRLGGPAVGLFGQMSSRIDLRLLEAVCDAGLDLLVVGPAVRTLDRARFDALVARPNVQWTGSRPHGSLPSYARCISVGLTPYDDTAFNRASFPLKTLDYLAAGRPVVSTPLPAVTALGCPDVHTASTPGEFAAAVERLVASPLRGADVTRRRDFAAQHSWQRRADTLLELLQVV